MNEKLIKQLNNQYNFEIYSAYIYLAMAAYFDDKNLKGFANWMKVQVQEELFHASKIYNFINDRGERVVFSQIPAPSSEWSTPKNVFEDALKHEKKITQNFNDLMKTADEVNDQATKVFLNWFINEQVEEESNVKEVIDHIKLTEGSASALFLIDKELLTRKAGPEVLAGLLSGVVAAI